MYIWAPAHWNEQQFYLFGQIQTSQTGGQPYSDTSPSVSGLCLKLVFTANLVYLQEGYVIYSSKISNFSSVRL